MRALDLMLIESLYAVLLGEAEWEGFLKLLVSERIDGRAVLMVHGNMGRAMGRLAIASGVDEKQARDYADYYSKVNPWLTETVLQGEARAQADHEVITREALHKTEYFADYLQPNGMYGSAGINISRRGGETTTLSMIFGDREPEAASEAAAVLERLRPTLLRVAQHYIRQAGVQTPERLGPDILDRLDIGTALIGQGGVPSGLSAAAERLGAEFDLFTLNAAGRLVFRDPVLQARLEAMLRRDYEGPPELVWPRPQFRLTLYRAGRDVMSDLLCGPMVGLLLEPAQTWVMQARQDELRDRFRLTRAEMRVLEGMMAGGSIRVLAEEVGRSPETIRTQIKSLLHKTGCESQTALLAMLARPVP